MMCAAKGKAFDLVLIRFLFDKVAGIAITQRNVLNRRSRKRSMWLLWKMMGTRAG